MSTAFLTLFLSVVSFHFRLIHILIWFTFRALRPRSDLIDPTPALQSLHITVNQEMVTLTQRRNITGYKGHETSALL